VSVLAVLLLATLPFIVQHVREGIYPALSGEDARGSGFFQDVEQEAVPMTEAPPPAAGAPVQAQANVAEPEAVEESDKRDDAVSDGKTKPKANGRWKATTSVSSGPVYRQFNAEVYDPSAMVQTGLAEVELVHDECPFSGPWSGQTPPPVSLPPGANLVLAILRASARAPFSWCRIGAALPGCARPRRRRGALPAAARRPSARGRPSNEMLEQLKTRLWPPTARRPASSSRMLLRCKERARRLREAMKRRHSSRRRGAVVPPASPSTARMPPGLSGPPTACLASRRRRHPRRVARGALPSQESVQIALPLKPHRVEAVVDGFLLEAPRRRPADNHCSSPARTQRAEAAGALAAGTLPAFVRVERTIPSG
jgi:hypothetical protein